MDYYGNVPGNKAKLKSVWLSQHHPAIGQSCTWTPSQPGCTPSNLRKGTSSYDLNVTTLTSHIWALCVTSRQHSTYGLPGFLYLPNDGCSKWWQPSLFFMKTQKWWTAPWTLSRSACINVGSSKDLLSIWLLWTRRYFSLKNNYFCFLKYVAQEDLDFCK